MDFFEFLKKSKHCRVKSSISLAIIKEVQFGVVVTFLIGKFRRIISASAN